MSECICEWDYRCSGTGQVQCAGCGGDQCVCAACFGHGETECDGCPDCAHNHGEVYELGGEGGCGG